MPCTSSCPSQDHASWGECVRAKGLRVGWANHVDGLDYTREKNWNHEISEYRRVRRAGIQPASTKLADIRRAEELSNRAGRPYDATSNTFKG